MNYQDRIEKARNMAKFVITKQAMEHPHEKKELSTGLTEYIFRSSSDPKAEIVFKKQNPHKTSIWSEMARRENDIYQVILRAPHWGSDYEWLYLGVVVNNTYLDYKHNAAKVDELKHGVKLITEKF